MKPTPKKSIHLALLVIIHLFLVQTQPAPHFGTKKPVPGQSLEKNIKFLMILTRHGARGPYKQSWVSDHWMTFDDSQIAQLTNVGKLQSWLNGFSIKKTYAEFLRTLNLSQLKIHARNTPRTKDSAVFFAKGLLEDFNGITHESLYRHLYDYDGTDLSGNKDQLINSSYTNWRSKSTSEDFAWENFDSPELTGDDTADLWEDKSTSLCKNYKREIEKVSKDGMVMDSELIKGFKQKLINDPQWREVQANPERENLDWKDISKIADFCLAQNTNSIVGSSGARCSEQLMHDIKLFYDFKYFGFHTVDQDKMVSNDFAKKWIGVLKYFQRTGGKSEAKIELFSKSDTVISPFYRAFLDFIPDRAEYLRTLDGNGQEADRLPARPEFADILTTEVYQEGLGEQKVKVFRNWNPMEGVCLGKDGGDCTLGEFISLVEGKILSDEEVDTLCG